ncbi:MAG TPA: Gfo/Idh/MocA family oxidoreductase [Bacteroidales bacterium]|nr:Gfo/Idh/MocA family oxidoreductase [Bacteroidales bacterium]
MINRKLRMGMVGGGTGAFIGAIHRIAAIMDGQAELVCGCFSSRPEVSLESGKALFLPENRIYSSYKEMFEQEAKLPENERMDFVAIVTPNHLHYEPCVMALEKGFHVVLDKPLTFSLEEGKKLRDKVNQTGLIFALTHTYSGYPIVKEARELVKKGIFGKIRRIYVEYPQGWLSDKEEDKGNVQAVWRTDPGRSGIAGCMGDIGTHAFHLAEYVSGLKATQLCAELNIFAPGRKLDDDGAALIRYNNGAKGVLMATQIAAGEENAIKIRLYGEKGGLEWTQADANTLLLKWPGKPVEILRTGQGYLGATAKHNTRTPGGHPEGYLEAFANIYRNFILAVKAKMEGKESKPEWLDFPGIEDGVRGMQFIETVVKSGFSDGPKWLDMVN